MKKLNEIARNCNITAYGFQALKDFAQESKKDGSSIVISSLSPAVMAEMGWTIMRLYCQEEQFSKRQMTYAMQT